MSIARQRLDKHFSAATDKLVETKLTKYEINTQYEYEYKICNTKLTHVSAATDGHGIIEELLEVVISVRFAPKL
jgi:hypothetical protein